MVDGSPEWEVKEVATNVPCLLDMTGLAQDPTWSPEQAVDAKGTGKIYFGPEADVRSGDVVVVTRPVDGGTFNILLSAPRVFDARSMHHLVFMVGQAK
ncbi:hypothetical protein [Mariniluteicoccus endophyticus]